jgi:enoyl-CoA hydratase
MTTSLVTSSTIDGAVALVTLNDPDHRNVLSPGMVEGIARAFDAAEGDPGIRAVVLAARGPAFCAGAELAVLEEAAEGNFSGVEDVYRGFLRVASFPAAGDRRGGRSRCRGRLQSGPGLRPADRVPRRGVRRAVCHVSPAARRGHAWLLEQAVGRQAATAISLFGERLDAADAADAGLAWRVCQDPAAASELPVTMAGRLRGLDRDYTEAFTRLLRSAGAFATHQQAVEHERFLQRWSVARPAFRQGVQEMREAVDRRSRPAPRPPG